MADPYAQPDSSNPGGGGTGAGTSGDPNQQAADETNSDIAAQIAPFQATIGQLTGQEKGALGELGKMFPQLQEAANQSAARLEGFYGGSLNFEQGIFNEANQRLNDFRQQRASEAQTLAQQMGAPVPINEFTYSADEAKDLGRNQFGAQMLHSLGYATAGVGEVESWAGKVFPLIRAEETQKTIHYFQDQINATQKQIDAIKATGPSLARSRADQLRLQQQQYNLDRLKEKHSFYLSQRQIAIQKAQLEQAEDNLELQKKQIAQQGATAATNRKVALSQLQIQQQREKLSEKELASKNQQYAGSLLDSVVHPSAGIKTVTRTTKVYVAGPNDAPPLKYDGKDKSGYWIMRDVKSAVATGVTSPIHDPNKAYDYLLSHGADRASAIAAIRHQYGLPPGWTPNHTYTFSADDLGRMDFNQLRNIALTFGWQPDPKHPRDSGYLKAWIMKQQQLKSAPKGGH